MALAVQQHLRDLSVRKCDDGLSAFRKAKTAPEHVNLQLSSVIHTDMKHSYQAWFLQTVVFHAQAQRIRLLQTHG